MQVAVLSCRFHDTLYWLVYVHIGKRYVKEINEQCRRVEDTSEDLYYIVSRDEHALGMEFDRYLIAPDYHSLEDTVKSRIR